MVVDELAVPVQDGQFGDAAIMAGLLGGGEEGRDGIDGHRGTDHTAPEAQHVRVVVLAGQGGRRHVVHHGRPDAGNLVGGHRDADPRPAGADTQLSQALDDGSPHGGAEVGIVDRQVGVGGAQVRDDVAPPCELVFEDLLESEPGMVRAEGDADEGSVYRAVRERPGDAGNHRRRDRRTRPGVDVQRTPSSEPLRVNQVRLRAPIRSAAST